MFYGSADISVTRRRSYTFHLLYDPDNVSKSLFSVTR